MCQKNLLNKDQQLANITLLTSGGVYQAFLVDGFATMMGGVFGTSPLTTYVESATGVLEGTSEKSCSAAAPLDRANFTGLVLGCIEANFCK